MTSLDILLSRASVSQLREPAPDGAALDLILKAGLRAPDHGRLRPWRFVLIRGDARNALAALVTAALQARDPDVAASLIERQRSKLLNTPLIIAVGARIQLGHKVPEIEQMLSVGAAAMNLLNAIHALGYGGIWVTGANCYDPAVAGALGFAAPDKLAGFLFVGTPEGTLPPVRRPGLADHVREWTVPLEPGPAGAGAVEEGVRHG